MRRARIAWPVGLGLISALLTFFTVYDQLFHRTGIEFILGDQLDRPGRSWPEWQSTPGNTGCCLSWWSRPRFGPSRTSSSAAKASVEEK